EPIVVGAAGVYQTFTITSINGDQLMCATPVSVASGFAAGTPVDHVWGNNSHPVSAISYAAWAQAIVNARRAESATGPNLLGAQSLGTPGPDAHGVANVPAGWVSVNLAQIASFTPVSYSPTAFTPPADDHAGTMIVTRGTDTGGTGIALATPINVQAGG